MRSEGDGASGPLFPCDALRRRSVLSVISPQQRGGGRGTAPRRVLCAGDGAIRGPRRRTSPGYRLQRRRLFGLTGRAEQSEGGSDTRRAGCANGRQTGPTRSTLGACYTAHSRARGSATSGQAAVRATEELDQDGQILLFCQNRPYILGAQGSRRQHRLSKVSATDVPSASPQRGPGRCRTERTISSATARAGLASARAPAASARHAARRRRRPRAREDRRRPAMTLAGGRPARVRLRPRRLPLRPQALLMLLSVSG